MKKRSIATLSIELPPNHQKLLIRPPSVLKRIFYKKKKVAESDNWSNPRVVEGEISLPVLFAGCLKRDVNAIRQLSTRADAASIVKQFL